ncbi:SRPBCC family protein [Parafrankia discariae]|uniref:SRPBCC family protein n=1 Tax=Parafrankia discariae TaxID=365528 RepID=UPI0003665818|nr:SRPBCC domain-containing protein [Parafrankia discariae]
MPTPSPSSDPSAPVTASGPVTAGPVAPDDAGGRSIRLEVTVAGTPAEVWETIATGPGISTWFVPAEVEQVEGGAVRLDFGGGLAESGRVLVWSPPHRFVYGGAAAPEEPAPAAHALAFEFAVAAAGDGTSSVVSLVNSGFAAEGAGDAAGGGELDAMREGWRLYLRNLQLYRARFAGWRASSIVITEMVPGPGDVVWRTVLDRLGLPVDVRSGRVASTAPDAPALAGTVEHDENRMLTLVTDVPGPGLAFLAVEGIGDQIALSVYLYLYYPPGDAAAARRAAAVAERDAPGWRRWLASIFPTA